MLALIERVESKPKMDGQRAVEHGCCEPPPPESYKPSPSSFHGLKRDQSQGVIDEVGCEIGQQHETRDKPYASNGHGGRSIYYEPPGVVYVAKTGAKEGGTACRAAAIANANCLTAFLLLTASTGSKFPDNRRFLGACRIPQFDLCKSHVRDNFLTRELEPKLKREELRYERRI